MASGLYDKGREGFLDGSIDWDSDDIKVVLIDTADYTVNLATHEDLADVAEASRVATSDNLANKTVAAGIADADDVGIDNVTGDSVEALIIYQDTGVAGTSRLIAYIDGFSMTPDGSAVIIEWDDGANKIFKL